MGYLYGILVLQYCPKKWDSIEWAVFFLIVDLLLTFCFFFGSLFFLILITKVFGQVPINGGGCLYAPILGAPLPPFLLLDPIRGAPLPAIFFMASIARGTPIDANKVPKNPHDCVFVGFIWTPEPD